MEASAGVNGQERPAPHASEAILAVVVTYGRRASLCCRAAESALLAGASRVIVVDNGADLESRVELAEWAALLERVEVIPLGYNAGSAVGFGTGLEAALAGGADFVWLLDDDNEVDADALCELIAEADRRAAGGVSNFALLSLRSDRPLLKALAGGRSVGETFPSHSSFLNFSMRDLPRRLRRRGSRCSGSPVSGLPYAPFGGLFLPRLVAEQIGLPDERFVVYEDDTEFTSRLARSGSDLVLVPRSRIADQTASWYAASHGRGPGRLIAASSDARVYYAVRNRVHFESTIWRRSRIMYQLNKAVVLAIVIAVGLGAQRLARVRLILAAVRDGECERLGRRVDLDSLA